MGTKTQTKAGHTDEHTEHTITRGNGVADYGDTGRFFQESAAATPPVSLLTFAKDRPNVAALTINNTQ